MNREDVIAVAVRLFAISSSVRLQMPSQSIVLLPFALLAIVAGIGLLLVRVDAAELNGSTHSMPGMALFRFRVFRYGAALACLVSALVAIASFFGWVQFGA